MTRSEPAALTARWQSPILTPEESRARDEEWAAYKRALKESRVDGLLLSAGVPDRYRKARLDGRYPCPILRSWVDEPTDGIILAGGIGTGKTWWAVAAMRAYLGRWNCSGRFIQASGFVHETIDSDFSWFIYPGILIFDDLGKEKSSEYFAEQFFKLIDGRVAANKKTIITTNGTPERLMHRIANASGEETVNALSSRMRRFTLVPVEGEDLR